MRWVPIPSWTSGKKSKLSADRSRPAVDVSAAVGLPDGYAGEVPILHVTLSAPVALYSVASWTGKCAGSNKSDWGVLLFQNFLSKTFRFDDFQQAAIAIAREHLDVLALYHFFGTLDEGLIHRGSELAAV